MQVSSAEEIWYWFQWGSNHTPPNCPKGHRSVCDWFLSQRGFGLANPKPLAANTHRVISEFQSRASKLVGCSVWFPLKNTQKGFPTKRRDTVHRGPDVLFVSKREVIDLPIDPPFARRKQAPKILQGRWLYAGSALILKDLDSTGITHMGNAKGACPSCFPAVDRESKQHREPLDSFGQARPKQNNSFVCV